MSDLKLEVQSAIDVVLVKLTFCPERVHVAAKDRLDDSMFGYEELTHALHLCSKQRQVSQPVPPITWTCGDRLSHSAPS